MPTDENSTNRNAKLILWSSLNTLSLDAPLIAMLWQYLFAKAYRIQIPLESSLLLGLSVWWLYIADRTADVYRNKKFARFTFRHAFYYKYKYLITYLALPALAIGICYNALFHLPGEILMKGLGLAFCVGIYFITFVLKNRGILSLFLSFILGITAILVLWIFPLPSAIKLVLGGFIFILLLVSSFGLFPTRSVIPKEFIAAYLFSIGTLLNVSQYVRSDGAKWFTEPTILFCMLCFMNLLTLSAKDYEIDSQAGVNDLLSQRSLKILFIGAGLILGSGIFALLQKPHFTHLSLAIAYSLGGSLLALCYAFRDRFSSDALHFAVDASLAVAAFGGLIYIWL